MPSEKRRNKAKPIISHPTLISRSDLSNFNDYVISFSPSADVAAGSGQTSPGSPTDLSDPPSSLRLSGALDVDIPSHHISHFGPLSDDTAASQQAPAASPNPSVTESLHSIIPLKVKKNSVINSVPEVQGAVEEGDIVFRQAAARAPVRSLYTPTSGRRSFTSIDARASQSIPIPPIPSPTKTVVPNQVGIDGRRQSLVNPEDYMPGLPASVSGGKAMSAGFDPVRPAPLRKASYVPAPVGRRRSSLKGTVATARSALNTGSEADFDITEFMPNAYDHGKVYGLDSRKESLASEYADFPSLYSNNYVGQAVVNVPSSKGEGPDSPNGKLDWRARFALKSPSPANLVQNSNEKFSVILSNDSSASLDEKSFGDHSYISHFKPSGFAGKKVSAHVVKLEAPGYSHLGRIMLRLSPVTFLLTTGATAFYLYLRATTLIKAQNTTGRDFRAAWAFLLSETVFAAWAFAYSLGQLISLRIKPAPRYSIKGDVGLPTVDVLVICTGQDAAMVMDATVAAARLDWPVEKLRVLVVDETGSEIIKRSVDYYATNRALHVTYHRRGKNAISPMGGWPKSSTINLGLSETRAEGRISGDYVVVLDAESIVEADFLRATLSHAMQNPLLALVQTKAGFYNLPKKLGSSFGTFMRCVEGETASRSGFVVRRSAIDDIGGFPTRSSIEDGRLKSCLEGKGYVTLAVDETLQYGMVPDSFSHHLKQQVTRQLAHVGTALRLGFFLFSRRTLHMPFGSRLMGLGRALAPFFSILIFLNAVALLIGLFYGGFLVPALSISELNTLIWAVFAALLMERVHDVFFAMPTGKATPRRFIQAQIFMAPYTMLGMLQSLVPRFLRRNVAPYWEPLEVGQPSERNSKCRIYFRHRLHSVLFGTHGWTHILLLTSLLAAIGYSLFLAIQPFVTHQRSLYQTGLLLLMTVAWPTLPWINVLLGSAVPFVYAMAPPSVPVREKLLNREPITGVARPLPERRRSSPFRQRHFGQFVLSMALIGYPLAIFVLTWTHISV